MIVSEPQLHYVDGLGLQGNCGYRVEEERVLVSVESITSGRDIENLSGSLSLELWANRQPFDGGELDGVVVARTDLGELQGQHLFPSCEHDLIFTQPPIGSWHLSLVLREWTEEGYQVRDFVNFELPYQVNWTPVLVDAAAKVVKADFAKEEQQPETAAAKPEKANDVEAKNPELKKANDVEEKKSELKKAAVKEAEEKEADEKEAEPTKNTVAKSSEVKTTVAKADTKSSVIAKPAEEAEKLPNAASVATAAVETAKKKAANKPVASSAKVNVNSASVAELIKVTGISKKLAEAIVADRPYKSVQALIKVKGMGARTLSKLETSFTVA